MSPNGKFKLEKLPSGKAIMRRYDDAGRLEEETHSYGLLEIALTQNFADGIKTAECYFANRHLVSRRTYETRRAAYPDMPPSDAVVEDFSGGLMRDLRMQQRSNKAEAEERLRQSAESRFPRPESTNWLRVIAEEKAHLVEFASRDWKALRKERELRAGPEWVELFGFHGTPQNSPCIYKGYEVGFEVAANRDALLDVTRRLLPEVVEFAGKPPEPVSQLFSFAPSRKAKKKQPLAWPTVLPPLIEFLSGLNEPVVKIFNHHR